jgi:CMP-N-acetylneuraminic acid synthetase
LKRDFDIVAMIFARGGSKGLPGKNLKPLLGKPLIGWAIEQALAVPRVRRVLVSTDSHEIAKVALQFGAEVPFLRPTELALDESPEWLAWRHALQFIKEEEDKFPDAMLAVPTTAPLRLATDLENCLDEFEKQDSDVVITVSESHRNPYFNMVAMNSDGTVQLVADSSNSVKRRQDAPRVYDIETVAYVVRPDFVMKKNGLFNGRVRPVVVPKERAIDIDTIHDFEIAEFLMKRRLQNG